jgi:hypothetical protein
MVTITQLRKVVKANNAAIQNMGSKASVRDLQRSIFQREQVYTLIRRMQAGENIQAEAARLGVTDQKHSGRAQSTFTRQADVIKESAWHRRHLKSTLPLAQQGTLYRKSGEKGYNAVATGTKAAEQAEAERHATRHTAKAPVQLAAHADWLLEAARHLPQGTKQEKSKHTRTVNKGQRLGALSVQAAISQAAARTDRDAARPEMARILG